MLLGGELDIITLYVITSVSLVIYIITQTLFVFFFPFYNFYALCFGSLLHEVCHCVMNDWKYASTLYTQRSISW